MFHNAFPLKQRKSIRSGNTHARTHLIIYEIVDLLQWPAIQLGGKRFKLCRQSRPVLDTQLPPRLEAVLPHQLHSLFLQLLQRLLGEGFHLGPVLRRRRSQRIRKSLLRIEDVELDAAFRAARIRHGSPRPGGRYVLLVAVVMSGGRRLWRFLFGSRHQLYLSGGLEKRNDMAKCSR